MKKKYMKYLALMDSTCIIVDSIISVIDAPETWWKDREVNTYNLN